MPLRRQRVSRTFEAKPTVAVGAFQRVWQLSGRTTRVLGHGRLDASEVEELDKTRGGLRVEGRGVGILPTEPRQVPTEVRTSGTLPLRRLRRSTVRSKVHVHEDPSKTAISRQEDPEDRGSLHDWVGGCWIGTSFPACRVTLRFPLSPPACYYIIIVSSAHLHHPPSPSPLTLTTIPYSYWQVPASPSAPLSPIPITCPRQDSTVDEDLAAT